MFTKMLPGWAGVGNKDAVNNVLGARTDCGGGGGGVPSAILLQGRRAGVAETGCKAERKTLIILSSPQNQFEESKASISQN